MSEPLDLEALRRRLGGRLTHGGRGWAGPGPGHSRRDASLSVKLTDDGKVLLHSFAGDSFGACAAYVGLASDGVQWSRRRSRKLTPFEAQLAASARFNRAYDRAREAAERRDADSAFRTAVWLGREPLGESAAADYLGRRGLPGPYADDLAFHPTAPLGYRPGREAPAMLALVRDAASQPTGLHVTPLQAGEGGKRERRMFGPVAGGSARLIPLDGRGLLAVAEGIETALSFWELYAIPAWAALSAPGLVAFVPPPGLTRLIIAADGDTPGMDAALSLAARLEGRLHVSISSAPDGRDWNDVLLHEQFGVRR